LNVAMGWENCHLWCFRVDSRTIGNVEDEDMGWEDDRKLRLSDVLDVTKSFEYEYDFGDGWAHVVLIEEVFDALPGKTYPNCSAGENACPPEDCGGPGGFEDFKEAVGDPDHEQ